MFKTVVVD